MSLADPTPTDSRKILKKYIYHGSWNLHFTYLNDVLNKMHASNTIKSTCVTPELTTYQVGANWIVSLPLYVKDASFDLKNCQILLRVENKEIKIMNCYMIDLSSS